MAGIFDTGIFDHATPFGIFDHFATEEVAPRGTILPPPIYGGWQKFVKGRREEECDGPECEELVEELAEAVEEAAPSLSDAETRLVALRLAQQMTWAQLRQIEAFDAFMARVEAELAEMDDEEVLLLAT